MKTYEATEEIKELFKEGIAADGCRDRAIKLVFATRRAIRFGKMAVESYAKAWDLARELYPEVAKGAWHYNHQSGEIREGVGRD